MIPPALALLLFFASSGENYRYWVQPCSDPATGCEAADAELADWALRAWQGESGKLLRLTKVDDARQAHIRVYWAGAREGVYGEARPVLVDGKQGAEIHVRPAPAMADTLLRDTIVYLTCLHETGHALGLPHTGNFEDIMYNFQLGGDIPEYFGRYRRKLKSHADIQSISGMSEFDKKRLASILTAK